MADARVSASGRAFISPSLFPGREESIGRWEAGKGDLQVTLRLRPFSYTSSNAFVASPNFGRRTFILSIIER
jgi:hypothetical protein